MAEQTPLTPGPTEVLFTPVHLGSVALNNRLVMAPLTRLRADADGSPNDLLVTHYAQRATMGMIVTEGTWPVQEGRTWVGQPGIETQAHIEEWRRVAEAVHAKGGKIVMQLMHGGRVSHPELTGTGRTVAPSAIAPDEPIRITQGKVPIPVPHALSVEEIPGVIAQFVQAGENAMAAGMDGVQLHGANGYLISQFLSEAANQRQDQYGATPADRARFAIEVAQAVVAAIGANHVGMRISPARVFTGLPEEDPASTLACYQALADGLAPLGLAHLDILHEDPACELVQTIRQRVNAPVMVNTGFASPTTREEVAAIMQANLAEAVGIGRAVIANPDLAKRWASGAPENGLDEATLYGDGAKGYTDYPFLEEG